MKLDELKQFYQGKRVLVTGHTGFKGSYLTVLLSLLGAEVYGYALKPPTKPSLFEILYGEGAGDESRAELLMRGNVPRQSGAPTADIGIRESSIGDIRDFERLQAFYRRVQPEIVFHLAAQPIVRRSYQEPRETYETNVMGTVNLLECLRCIGGCRSFLNVTTDKVYRNDERAGYGYREEDQLDGYDPYSNSKSCSELVTHSYKSAFLDAAGVAVSTARAGNVIGGGDFAEDRILPDCVRAAEAGAAVSVRNPYSTRPYQHVFEPLIVYLRIAMLQEKNACYAGWYNVGPDDCDCVTTGTLVDLFVKAWGDGLSWENACKDANAPHEANFLKLDNEKVKRVLGWKPVWHIEEAVGATAEWAKAWLAGGSRAANEVLLQQSERYLKALQ